MIRVTRLAALAPADRDAVVAFLDGASGACLFHRPEWHAVIHSTYGHSTHWFVARDEGAAIVGVFPVVAVRHPLLGLKLVAVPYQFHAGAPLAADDAVGRALAESAVAFARERGARHLEIRHFAAVPYLEHAGFAALDAGLVATERPIAELEAAELRHGHRAYIDHCIRRGVEIVESSTIDGLRAFRTLYRIEQRALGAPQAGAPLFESIDRHLRSRYRLLLASLHGQTIGGLLTLEDGITAFVRCTATSHPDARRLSVSKALYWRAMLGAREGGCRVFHFGASARADRGLIAFKEGWRATTRPVHLYGYALRGSPPVPGSYFEGYRLAKAVWRRLPLPVVDWLGQRVTRWIC
ncbi:MAG TPA: GNAT family N-acetyltransferase [Thermoanaerobaculia bacterium]|jgi:hypothetical protein